MKKTRKAPKRSRGGLLPMSKEESPYSRFFWLVVTSIIGGSGVLFVFGAGLWAKLERMDERVTSLTSTIVKLEESVSSKSKEEYTRSDATHDKELIVRELANSSSRIDALAERANTNMVRLNDFSDRVTRLEALRPK